MNVEIEEMWKTALRRMASCVGKCIDAGALDGSDGQASLQEQTIAAADVRHAKQARPGMPRCLAEQPLPKRALRIRLSRR